MKDRERDRETERDIPSRESRVRRGKQRANRDRGVKRKEKRKLINREGKRENRINGQKEREVTGGR